MSSENSPGDILIACIGLDAAALSIEHQEILKAPAFYGVSLDAIPDPEDIKYETREEGK